MSNQGGWKQTSGRKPKTGDRLLRVMFRCGVESRFAYAAKQLRWTDTGDEWDIVGVRRA